jgi:phospholipase/carboxylesterase
MRRAYHVARFARLLAIILAGCDRAPPPSSEPAVLSALSRTAAASSPGQRFQQPLPNGWGRAEGLEYREFVRGAAAPDQLLPLVMIIHGMGDQPGEHWFDAIPIDFPARIIMPQAPTPYLDGFSWFTYRVGDNEPQALGRAIAEMADRLARALTALQAYGLFEHCWQEHGFPSLSSPQTYLLLKPAPSLLPLATGRRQS